GLPDSSERWARDPEIGKGEYVENMTFNEWKKQYVDEPKYMKIKALLGEHAPKKRELFSLNRKSEQYEKLSNDIKTIDYIRKSKTETQSITKRNIAEEAYFSFKNDGILVSGHAALQYASRMQQKKNGRFLYNYETIKRVAKMPANYIDTRNNRLIEYYDKIAIIKESTTGKVVTIIRQRKPGSRWDKIEKK
ncbi:MAG: hypothetical protein M3Z87_19325, partial [Lactobacillus sp.]|nr:hypothetical protein [Lactobacillus sp.]